MMESVLHTYRFFFLWLSAPFGFGVGLVLLSLLTSALMAPLLRLAARVVQRERDYQTVLGPQLQRIIASSAGGAEEHRRVEALYARYGYSPVLAVRKVLPLFIQVPVLLLTYFMLKGTTELAGVPLGPVADLGAPDGLLGGINLLPVAMTLVNLLAALTTPGFSRRELAQATGVSLLFLFLLYSASAALLFYWTLNNLLTLLRNLVPAAPRTLLRIRRVLRGGAVGATMRFRLRPVWALLLRASLGASFGLTLLSLYSYVVFKCHASGSFTSKISVHMAVACMHAALGLLLLGGCAAGEAHRPARLPRLVTELLFLAALSLHGLMFLDRVFSTMWLYARLHTLLPVVVIMQYAAMVIAGWTLFPPAASPAFRPAVRQGYLWLWLIFLAIHYLMANRNIDLDPMAFVRLSGYMLLPALTAAAALLLVFSRMVAVAPVVQCAFAASLSFCLVPLISRGQGVLRPSQNIFFQYLLLAGVTGAVLYLANRQPRFLRFYTLVVGLVAAVGVGCAFQGNPAGRPTAPRGRAAAYDLGSFADVTLRRTNSVILLVYDGYAAPPILRDAGIDPDAQIDFLKQAGFTVYDSAYTTIWETVPSMSAFFNIDQTPMASPRGTLAGDNKANALLQKHGYKTHYVLSSYLLNPSILINEGGRLWGDFYFPEPAEGGIPLEDVLWINIRRGIFSQAPTSFNKYTPGEWLAAKRALLERAEPEGFFMYAHSDLPGHTFWDPNFRADDAAELTSYKEDMAKANQEMREDVELLRDRRDAIVIVAGDHGGYLFSVHRWLTEHDALGLADLHGLFLAIRWPADHQPCLDLSCFQNVMLEVLIYLSGDRRLARWDREGATEAPPSAFIYRGIVQHGVDKGRPLFDAARQRLAELENLDSNRPSSP
jgi:hypothetical protein